MSSRPSMSLSLVAHYSFGKPGVVTEVFFLRSLGCGNEVSIFIYQIIYKSSLSGLWGLRKLWGLGGYGV